MKKLRRDLLDRQHLKDIHERHDVVLTRKKLLDLNNALIVPHKISLDGHPIGGGYYQIGQVDLMRLGFTLEDLKKLPPNVLDNQPGIPTTVLTEEALPGDPTESVYVFSKPNLEKLIEQSRGTGRVIAEL